MDKGHYYRPLSFFRSSLAVSQNSGLTNQAHRIHCSAKNVLTMRHIYKVSLLAALEYVDKGGD